MKTRSFDRTFDLGEDISSALDLCQAQRTNQKCLRVSVDFPAWVVHALDREAGRLGVTRQSIIKVWISERLKQESAV